MATGFREVMSTSPSQVVLAPDVAGPSRAGGVLLTPQQNWSPRDVRMLHVLSHPDAPVKQPPGWCVLVREVEQPPGWCVLVREVEQPPGWCALVREVEQPPGWCVLVREVEQPPWFGARWSAR